MLLRASLLLAFLVLSESAAARNAGPAMSGIIGLYIHEQWPYKHPYSPRTWSLEDWRGYATGLRRLGYNTVMIWPMLEIIPEPLTDSDRHSLEIDARVIDMLHHQLGMRVLIVMCPNIVAAPGAAREPFTERHFFWSTQLVDPRDRPAVARMMYWRQELFGYLRAADGLAMIDSDPGGYPHSDNAAFVSLLALHRQMLDGLRPGIELDYWVLAGWRAWGEFLGGGRLRWGTEDEFVDTLTRLKHLNPEPWGLLNGLQSPQNDDLIGKDLHYIGATGLESRVISYNYGAIEFEPSLPVTNFGGTQAQAAGAARSARGVLSNTQTPCMQLPNTFAFVRGALSQPVRHADYVEFADRLIVDQGPLIVDSWEALSSADASGMRQQVERLRRLRHGELRLGDLGGLLFGDGHRFVEDLALELELRAAYQDMKVATESGRGKKSALLQLATATTQWQQATGFQARWNLPEVETDLRKVGSPAIDAVFAEPDVSTASAVSRFHEREETFMPRLIEALTQAANTARD